ncbi:nickel-responsive transcriptional regulator NikR [Verticiella sediminum]|uniref:Putative nickel-responsive regulator n=1 Tax=Verticiella sediminum TaxID=1247510 RepID=A0A556B1K4_9BURK|nr:nickel-responsive transcriptional regulator NikR [Verticiella sediminum]TSH99034.1 nickel-responsive transcriptional regulator NikR [Verticiella sediminum]
MRRLTITLEDDLLAAVDALCRERGYASRSEAFRDLVRAGLAQPAGGAAQAQAPCFATLSYVYDHDLRDLSKRLTSAQHHRHDLSVVTTHVHLDEHACLEVSVLKGRADELRAFADGLTSQRGVRYGHLALIPANIATEAAHGHTHHHHGHASGKGDDDGGQAA